MAKHVPKKPSQLTKTYSTTEKQDYAEILAKLDDLTMALEMFIQRLDYGPELTGTGCDFFEAVQQPLPLLKVANHILPTGLPEGLTEAN